MAFTKWAEVDSNHRSRRRQIYSLIHLAALESAHMKLFGAGDWTRTHNLLITNQLLCQLSYTGMGVLHRFGGALGRYLDKVKSVGEYEPPLFLIFTRLARTTESKFSHYSQVLTKTHARNGRTVLVVPWGGIEPPTGRFSVCCSTD